MERKRIYEGFIIDGRDGIFKWFWWLNDTGLFHSIVFLICSIAFDIVRRNLVLKGWKFGLVSKIA